MARPRRQNAIGPVKLMLIRKLFFMSMTEAAEVLCNVRQRSYHQYETGVVGMPKETEDRVLMAIALRNEKLQELTAIYVEKKYGESQSLYVIPLERWLDAHNPNHKDLLDCKLDWFIDMSVKAELVAKYGFEADNL